MLFVDTLSFQLIPTSQMISNAMRGNTRNVQVILTGELFELAKLLKQAHPVRMLRTQSLGSILVGGNATF